MILAMQALWQLYSLLFWLYLPCLYAELMQSKEKEQLISVIGGENSEEKRRNRKKAWNRLLVILNSGGLALSIYLCDLLCIKPGSEVIAVPPKFFPKVFSIENFSGLLEWM